MTVPVHPGDSLLVTVDNPTYDTWSSYTSPCTTTIVQAQEIGSKNDDDGMTNINGPMFCNHSFNTAERSTTFSFTPQILWNDPGFTDRLIVIMHKYDSFNSVDSDWSQCSIVVVPAED